MDLYRVLNVIESCLKAIILQKILYILNVYQKEILNEIDKILYKFTILDISSVTLYYNTYTIKNEKHMIHKLLNLYDLIHN